MRLAFLLLLLFCACSSEPNEVRATLSLADAMASGDTAGFLRAVEPRVFDFPSDHGPHPGYRVEWWYVTGNLEDDAGRRFGFQLTFFRSAQTPQPPERSSAWAAADIWMAHFALSDPANERFFADERFARGAAGLAGAQADPFRVHLEDWSVESMEDDATFPVRLRASSPELSLDLVLERGKPPVLQGESGLSRKGPEPGNASYYYSLTRMPAQGTVSVDGRAHEVRGSAWLDREWSTSALGRDLVGWDWFALQLDDGRDLMLYQLRRTDGSEDAFSAGVLVSADGVATRLTAADFALTPLGDWRSSLDEVTYPREWRVEVPAHRLMLTVTPVLADQELNLTVRYWEGAVDVTGSAGGRGYLEMTGYAESEKPDPGRGR